MHRRDAAQHRVAHVHRRRTGASDQCDGPGTDIGNQAQRIDHIQAPRLGRDIAGRIAQAEKRCQRHAARFGDDVATAVLAETVTHDAVETGDVTHLFGGHLEQRDQVFLPFQAVQRIVRFQGEHAQGVEAEFALLEFDQDPAAMRVHDAVEQTGAEIDFARERKRFAAFDRHQAAFDHGQHRRRQRELLHRLTQGRAQLQQRGDIRTPRFEQTGAIEHQHRAVRLHRAGKMDRFIGAVEQGRWCDKHRAGVGAQRVAAGLESGSVQCGFRDGTMQPQSGKKGGRDACTGLARGCAAKLPVNNLQ